MCVWGGGGGGAGGVNFSQYYGNQAHHSIIKLG